MTHQFLQDKFTQEFLSYQPISRTGPFLTGQCCVGAAGWPSLKSHHQTGAPTIKIYKGMQKMTYFILFYLINFARQENYERSIPYACKDVSKRQALPHFAFSFWFFLFSKEKTKKKCSQKWNCAI